MPGLDNSQDRGNNREGTYWERNQNPLEHPTSSNGGALQVEAHVVPETHDIDVIVNSRVNRELQAKMQGVAVADAVALPEEKRLCYLPRNIFLGFVSLVIFVIVATTAVGVSIGVSRPSSASGSSLQSSSRPITVLSAKPSSKPGSNELSFQPTTKIPSVAPSTGLTFNPTSKLMQSLTPLESYVLNAINHGSTITSLVSSNFSTIKLSGRIPTEIGLLTRLSKLDLNSNSLTGSIPTNIGSLTILTYLNFDNNLLQGTNPTAMALLTSLAYLSLGVNSLSGPIPSQIGLLTSLTLLDLSINSLTGTIPAQMGLLSSLIDLRLYSNGLIGPMPNKIGSLTSLVFLDIHSNSFSESIPYGDVHSYKVNRFLCVEQRMDGNNPYTDWISNDPDRFGPWVLIH